MSNARRSTSRNGEIPVAPLRRHIQRWIDSQGYDPVVESRFGDTTGQFSPSRKFIETIWPEGAWENKCHALSRIMRESESVSFDLADRIICEVLCEPDLWISDDELAEAYANVDLRGLDATKPTSEKAAEQVGKTVSRAYRELGSINGIVRQQGISHNRVKEILQARGEYACT